VTIESNPDIAEIAARLGGAGPADEAQLHFTYGDVVAVVQALADQQKISAAVRAGNDKGNGSGGAGDGRVTVAFVLQEIPRDAGPSMMDVPAAPGEQQRPQTSSPGTVSFKK
jgi:hypothetical protein